MSIQLIVQLCAYAISIGCLYGAISTRLSILEKKVDVHNHLVERTYRLEGQMREAEHDIRDMKNRKEP